MMPLYKKEGKRDRELPQFLWKEQFPLTSCTSTGSNSFLTSPDFLPILISGTYLRIQPATQQGLHDASLHSLTLACMLTTAATML